MKLITKDQIAIVENRKIWMIIAAVVMLVGVAFMFINGFNFDTDFAGGISLQYDLHTPLDKAELDSIRELVNSVDGITVTSIQKSGDDSNCVIIKAADTTPEVISEVYKQLNIKYGAPVVEETEETTEETATPSELETATPAEVETATPAEVEETTEEAPVVEETTEEAPVAEETTEEAPAAEETTEEAPAVEETTEEAPVAEETTEEAPAAEETTEEAPAAEETTEEAPVAEETTEDAPAVEEIVYGGTVPVEKLSESRISASISNEIKQSAIIATVIAVILMLVYIAIRFEFRSAVAAILCLIHDIFIVFASYAVFGIPVSSNLIAVMLTILGYSINATIVLFDRIRENRRKMGRTDFGVVVNISARQTLMRSINTTITTLFTIGMIYILGVHSIKEFALPIIVGVVAGLYSSVFLSGSFWYMLTPKRKGN